MDIKKAIDEYDEIWGKVSLTELHDFLTSKVAEANAEGDKGAELTLLNELIGFLRDSGNKAEGIPVCERILKLVTELDILYTLPGGTSILNAATALKVFGDYEQSERLYIKLEEIFDTILPAGDFNFSGLYNNYALLCIEKQNYKKAETLLKKSLAIVDLHPEAKVEQATSRINLAAAMLREYAPGSDGFNEALVLIDEAIAVYEQDEEKNFHYSSALSVKAQALLKEGRYEESAALFERAMEEHKKFYGETGNYAGLKSSYEYVKSLMEGGNKND